MKTGIWKKSGEFLKKQMLLLFIASLFLNAFTSLYSVSAAGEVTADYEPAGTVAHYPLNNTYQYKNKLNETQSLAGDRPVWRSDYVSLVRGDMSGSGQHQNHIAGNNPSPAINGKAISFSFNAKVNSTQTRAVGAQSAIFVYGGKTDYAANSLVVRPYHAEGMSAVVLRQNSTDAVVATFPRPAADVWHNYAIALDGNTNGKLTVWVDGEQVAQVAAQGIGADEIGNQVIRLNRGADLINVDAHYRDVRIINNVIDQSTVQTLSDEIDTFVWNELLAAQTLTEGATVSGDLTLVQGSGISWESSNTSIINPQTGVVTRPSGLSAEDANVQLTLKWREYSQAYNVVVLKKDNSLSSITAAHYPLNSSYQYKNKLNANQALSGSDPVWRADYVSLVNPGNANNGHIAGTNPGTAITGKKISFSLNVKLNSNQTRAATAANTLFSFGKDNDNNITLRPYYSAGMSAVVLKRNGTDTVVASFPAPLADMWHNYTISLDGTAAAGKLIVWVDGEKAAEVASNGIGADELGNGQFRLNRTISTFSNLDSHYRDVRIFNDTVDSEAAALLANEIRSFTWADLLALKPLTDGQIVRTDLALLRDANIEWTSSDEAVIQAATGAVTRPAKGTTAKTITVTMNWFDYSQDYTVIVPPYDAGDSLIADFNFDDTVSGLAGSGAKAAVQGTASYADSFEGNGKAARIGSGFWLNVTKTDGTPLLAELNEFTISYDSKASRGSGWTFFAAPSTSMQTYLNEHYVAVIDKTADITVERYNNSGARPESAGTSSGTEWKHVDVVFSAADTKLYIDGELKSTIASSYAVSDILTAAGGILQVGKGNWGSGEYYEGLIDNFKIFNKALTQDDMIEYQVTNIAPVIAPASGQTYVPVTISHPAGNKYIYYTTDGSDPTVDSTRYAGPFAVEHGITVKAAAIAANGTSSEIATMQYYGSQWAATANAFRLNGQSTVNNIKISWPVIAGASYYEVYRDNQLVGRTYGDVIDEYGLEVDKQYIYDVKAISKGVQIGLAQTNAVNTFAYDPASITKKKDNYTGVDSLEAGSTYGVKLGDTWYHYVYRAVKDPDTSEVTTSIYELTSTDGRSYGNERLLGSFTDMRVEGAGYRLNPENGKVVFTAHEEASSGYTRAHIFISSVTPGGNDFAATFRGRPFDMDARDMVLFVDEDDNSAYLFFATRGNNDMAIVSLDENWEQPVALVNTAFVGKHKESPTVIKHEGRYYFFGSTANGWYPSQGEYASAERLDGEWTPLRPIGNAASFATQANGVGKWTGSNGRFAYAQNGYHWGAQYAADFKDPMGTYARLFPMVFHNGVATADWFYQLDSDAVYGMIPVQSGQYLSLGKNATDSQGLDATALTDGADLATASRIQHNTLPYNIVIDLEGPARLSEINFTTRVVGGSDTVYRYKLEGSIDNESWTELVDGSQNNVVGFVHNPLADSGKYRYVRLTVNNVINVHTNQGATWADGIIELAVFGTPHIDKSQLQAKYDEKKDSVKGNYTNAAWNTIIRALNHAEAVLADSQATQWTVDRAALQIDEAFKWALTVKPDNIVDYSQFGVPVGETWYDTEGNPIQAHGGGFLQQTADDGKPIYYWVGENKIHNSAVFHAVALYSSRDLVNWTYEGDIVDKFTATVEGAEYTLINNKWERPKLLFNEKTQKYVLWGHWETAGSYASSQIVVATADHAAGPYTVLGHWRPGGTLRNWRSEGSTVLDSEYFKTSGVKASIPTDVLNDVTKMGYTSRDFTVFMDDDGTAYLMSAEGHSMRVHRLNEEFTDVDFTTYTFSDPAAKAEEFESYSFYDGVGREAPAVVRAEHGYYMASSGQSGWLPNQGTISYTTDLKDPQGWTPVRGEDRRIIEKYAFGNNSTYYSQPTNIMKLTNPEGEKTYVYMGDRWRSGQLSDSRYVWLPMTLAEDEQTASMEYTTGWRLDAATGNVQFPTVDLVSQGKQAAITNNDSVSGIEKANDGIAYNLNVSGDSTHFFGGLVGPYEYTVDLGEIYDLARIDVAYRLYNGSEMYHEYEIWASEDNANWTKLIDKNTNTWAGFNSDLLSGSYRYVKLKVNNVKRVNNNANSNGWGSGLIEVQVYAKSVVPLDKTALSNTIAAAEQVLADAEEGTEAGQYPATAIEALEAAILAAQLLADSTAVTQEDIDAAVASLEIAVEAFKSAVNVALPVDKAALNSKIAEAEQLLSGAVEGTEPGQYPPIAVTMLQAAITAAQAVANDAAAKQNNINEAVESLEAARIAFAVSVNKEEEPEPSVNKTALNSKIAEAEQLLSGAVEGTEPGQYPVTSMEALQAAVDTVQTVLEDLNATQDEVDAAVASLTEAITTFAASVNGEVEPEPTVDKTSLSAKIAETEQLLVNAEAGSLPGQYPAAAIAALEDAIQVAQALFDNATATQNAVNEAAANLTAAIATFAAAINVETEETDTAAPAWPSNSGMTITNVTTTSLVLTWTAAEDNVAVTAYKVTWADGSREVAGDVASMEVSGLQSNTSYTFKVEAADAAGNWSEDGPTATVMTGSSGGGYIPPVEPEQPVDKEEPTIPTGEEPETSGQQPEQPQAEFKDVPAGHWAEAAIKRAAALHIVKGNPGHTFKPDAATTRAEFMVMLANAFKWEGEKTELAFRDADRIGAWAADAIAQGIQRGIITGYTDGSFRPNQEITRTEMIVLLARALGISLSEIEHTGFTDDAAIPAWGKGAVEALRKLGIIEGRSNQSFVPNDNATRAEAIVIILRALEN